MAATTDTMSEAETGALELEVSDFGPIVHAKVHLRPLTVFVGPSNTGKSYFAMLIYALHRFFGVRQFPLRMNPDGSLTIGSRAAPEMSGKAIRATFEFMRAAEEASTSPTGGRVPLSPDACQALRSGFAERAELLNDEVKRCFGVGDPSALVRRERKTAAHVTIRRFAADDSKPVEHALTIGRKPELKVALPPRASVWVDHEPDMPSGTLDMLRSLPDQAKGLTQSMAWLSLAGLMLPQTIGPLGLAAYYLPADRTGAMHFYKLVARALIANTASARPGAAAATSMLTGVAADFLGQLIEQSEAAPGRPTQGQDLGRSLEATILDGSVRIEESEAIGVPHFLYRPKGWKHDLELANASSMVSELAPVVLYLRHLLRPGNVMILEEPESHLHPAMQVELTRQLAALVAAGIRVIVTTHSEWLVEELANVVQRSSIPESERKGTALAPDQVGVWLFEQKGRPKGSVVSEIRMDEDGLFGTGFDEVASALHNDWADVTRHIERIP